MCRKDSNTKKQTFISLTLYNKTDYLATNLSFDIDGWSLKYFQLNELLYIKMMIVINAGHRYAMIPFSFNLT